MKDKEIIAGGTDAAANINSNALGLGDLKDFSIHVLFSGGGSDLVGTLTLQSSNDELNWVEIAGSSQAVAASADHMYNVSNANYKFVRTVWSHTSGTGEIQGLGTIKENPIIGA